jgi:hypothetical protein
MSLTKQANLFANVLFGVGSRGGHRHERTIRIRSGQVMRTAWRKHGAAVDCSCGGVTQG